MALAQGVVRGLSVSHVLTSGNSCDVDMADFVNYLATDPSCASIACVFEGMATPERLLLAAENAWAVDKPLVIFKMATGEQGAAAAMSHTGSLAGSHASYRAVFQRAGADRGRRFRGADGNRGVLRQGAAAEGRAARRWSRPRAGRRSWRPTGRSSTACRCRSRCRTSEAILESRIPEFGSARNPCDVTAQVLGDPESLGICADALLGDPQYGVLVSPLTYGYAPSAKRPQVYSELAEQHGKMACVVWQTEWQDGPGVVEANQCDRVALFRSMNACFAALAAWHWRADKRAAGAQIVAATTAGSDRPDTRR